MARPSLGLPTSLTREGAAGISRGRHEPAEPGPHGLADGGLVLPQAVVPRDDDDRPAGCLGRHAEGVAVALDDEGGYVRGVELGQPAGAVGTPRWLEREGEAEHSDRVERPGGAARDPGAGGASADDEGQLREGPRSQVEG